MSRLSEPYDICLLVMNDLSGRVFKGNMKNCLLISQSPHFQRLHMTMGSPLAYFVCGSAFNEYWSTRALISTCRVTSVMELLRLTLLLIKDQRIRHHSGISLNREDLLNGHCIVYGCFHL